MGYGAIQIQEGITLLSELGIDIEKDWQTYRIKNLSDPADDQDADTKAARVAALLDYLLLAGGTMTGPIAMGTNKITGLGNPVANQDADTKAARNAALLDLVPAVTVSEPSRALNTIYQGHATKTRICLVTIKSTIYLGNIYGDNASGCYGAVSVNTPPSSAEAGYVEAHQRLINRDEALDPFAATQTAYHELVFIVPPAYYYRVSSYTSGGGGTPLLIKWFEYDLEVAL